MCHCHASHPQGSLNLKLTSTTLNEFPRQVLEEHEDGWWRGRLPTTRQTVHICTYIMSHFQPRVCSFLKSSLPFIRQLSGPVSVEFCGGEDCR